MSDDGYPDINGLESSVPAWYRHLPDTYLRQLGLLKGRPRRKSVARSVRKAVYDRDDWRCVKCGSCVDLTLDHIVPVSRGGTNRPQNLQTMCATCNVAKGNRES